MDALYDNLDNYNESKLIDELRNENLELKTKIEKYAVTLDKLQKEFDKLAAEYKKLELNYSSLLKTARAEVERKTQIITNLNIEKDMMVLNAIQNKNVLNVRRNWTKGQTNNNTELTHTTQQYSAKEAGAQNKTAANQPKAQNYGPRNEDSTTPKDTNNTVSAENASKLNTNDTKFLDRISDAKENVREGQKNRPSKPASIRDRRKSLPASSFSLSKFSSDEEGEVISPVKEPRNNPISKDMKNKRNTDTNHTKDNNQDHDPYNRNRNYDTDKYQYRDRFQSRRHRLSPERFHRRSKRDYSGDRRFPRDRIQHRDSSGGYRSDKDGERLNRDGNSDNRQFYDRFEHRPYRDGSGDFRPYRDGSGDRRTYRDSSGEQNTCRDDVGEQKPYREGPEKKPRRDEVGDYKKHRRDEPVDNKKSELRKRRLESPLGDKFQQYQQKNHEEFEREYNDERNQYLDDAGNPKYHSDYEMPSNKRMRTESYHKSDQDKSFKGKAQDQAPRTTLESIQSEDLSCQSPDYLTTELAAVPKEIKLDAEMKIDDPREHSNKYTIRTEKGEKVLSTVTGRSVELKPVNKSVWNIVEVEIPVALVRRPSQCSEDRINEVYGDMDIDNPASDISSVESGETMGSLYDISTDPFHFCHSDDIRRKERKGNQNTTKNKTVTDTDIQAEKGDDKPRSIEKDSSKLDEVDMLDMIALGKNVDQSHDKMGTQAECPLEPSQTVEKSVISSEKCAKDLQSSVQDSIGPESVVKPLISEKEADKNVTDATDTKESSKLLRSKYKIPKVKSGRSSSRERKLSHDKNVGDKVEDDKHDHSSLIHKSLNKNTAERKDNLTAAAIGKAMVEGDLALSDESSDMDLSKRCLKDIVEKSTCELKKATTTEIDIGVDSKIEDAGCMISKSTSRIGTQSDIDPKLSEDKTKIESNDTSKKGKSKSKTKQRKSEEAHKHHEQGTAISENSKLKLAEKEVTRDIKSKFCDLFGENSSLITPEDLGLTAQEVRIESSSSNYFPIFEDAQDAADMGAKVEQTKVDLLGILDNPHLSKSSKNAEQNKNIHFNNPNKEEKEVNNDCGDKDKIKNKPQRGKSKEKEHNIKPKETSETKTKSCKNTEKEHVSKTVEENETKASRSVEKQLLKKVDADKTKVKSKSLQKEQCDPATLEANKAKHSEADVTKAKNKQSDKSKTKHERNEADETKSSSKITEKSTKSQSETDENSSKDASSKNSEIDKCDKRDAKQAKSKPNKDTETEANDTKINTIEVKRRKSKRHEEKSQPLTIETEDTPQPAVITVDNAINAQITFDNSISNSLHTYEPGVVKTVIISSGVQPLTAQENVPLNVISPILEHPLTPNIENRQKFGIPMSHTVQIHALATSTPAKEIRNEDINVSCKTPNVSNGSVDQNSVSNADSRNDNDVPDVRIFVKRRRRVVKKTTPSKT